MRLLDVNLLLYAVDEDSARHVPAKAWLEQVLSEREPVALPWVVLLAFVRLSTKSVSFARPLTVDEALDLVDGWLALPQVSVVHPSSRHSEILRELLVAYGTGGNLTTDAHLAALAIEHGAVLCSCDADFSRFPGVRWIDPLQESGRPRRR